MAGKVAENELSTAPGTPSSQLGSRIEQADVIIQRNVIFALAVGVVPIPIFDFVGMEVIQVKMLSELGKLYELNLSEDLGKKVAGSLFSAVWSVGAGAVLGYSFARFIPVVGQIMGMMAMPLLAAASTRALGKTFVMHFESGGSLLDFEPQKMRSFFLAELKRSKRAVAGMQGEVRKP
jgi:uncharacterized protein (DUF697 family)